MTSATPRDFVEDFAESMRNMMTLVDRFTQQEVVNRTDKTIMDLLDEINTTSGARRGLMGEYARLALRRSRENAMASRGGYSPDELMRAAMELVGWNFVQTSATPYEGQVVRRAHWRSRCYVRNFGDGRKGGRVAFQSFKVNQDGTFVSSAIVTDKEFTHPESKTGYYPLNIERTFAKVETAYSESMTRVRRGVEHATDFDYAVMLALYVTNEARIPPREGSVTGFPKNLYNVTRGNISQAIFDAFNHIGAQHASLVKSYGQRNFISPFLPSSERRLPDGTMVRALPVGAHLTLLMSTRPLTRREKVEQGERFNRALIKRAGRHGVALYMDLNAPLRENFLLD